MIINADGNQHAYLCSYWDWCLHQTHINYCIQFQSGPNNGYDVPYIVTDFDIGYNNQTLLRLMSKSDLIINCNWSNQTHTTYMFLKIEANFYIGIIIILADPGQPK